MFRSIGITFGSKLFAAIVNFATIILLSNILGPEGKGQCSLYLVILSTSLILCECISGSAVVYLMTKFSHKQLLTLFYAWSVPCALVAATAFYLGGKIGHREWILVSLLCWLNAALSMHQLIALGKKKITLYNGLNILQAALGILAIIAFFKWQMASPFHYLLALCTGWTITAIIGLLAVSKMEDQQDKTSWTNLVRQGMKAGVANQLGTLLQLFNTRIGYMLLPAMQLGIFSNAISLCEASLLINSSIGTVQYARTVAEENRSLQLKLTHQCFWGSAWLMTAALVILWLVPPFFFAWIFGPRFDLIALSIRYLAPGILLYSGYVILSYFFSGTGRFHLNNYPAFAALVFTAVTYLFIYIRGYEVNVEVVSVILVFSYAVLFMVSLWLFLRFEKLSLRRWMQMPSVSSLKKLV